MRIILAAAFWRVIENNTILLDTSFFIDALIHPIEFGKFYNELKAYDVILVTLSSVKAEFFKGAANATKYKEKEKIIDNFVDSYLPEESRTYDNVFELIKKYQEQGKSLSITDLLLGATLLKYPKRLLLMTKNTTEFPLNIFELKTYLLLSHNKGLQSYGFYSSK